MLLVPVPVSACSDGWSVTGGRAGALLAVAGVLFTGWMAVTIAAESQASGLASAAAHAAWEASRPRSEYPVAGLAG